MFKFIVYIVFLLSVSPALAYYPNYGNNGFNSQLKMNQPKTVIVSNPSHQRYYPHRHPYSYNPYTPSDLNALERYALKKNYRRENDIQRLERLEDLAFGAVQAGDLNQRFRNVENAILSRPQNNYRQSVWNTLSNYFAGQPTGFTPSIWDGPNMGSYGNQNIEQYSNGIFGGGWGIQNNSFGSGSSVRILD